MPIPTEALRSVESTDPRTGAPIRLAIDADCPHCGWPERFFDTGTKTFGCRKCDYTSEERDA